MLLSLFLAARLFVQGIAVLLLTVVTTVAVEGIADRMPASSR